MKNCCPRLVGVKHLVDGDTRWRFVKQDDLMDMGFPTTARQFHHKLETDVEEGINMFLGRSSIQFPMD